MSKDGEVESSLSERPGHYRPRRLIEWLNPTGARKAHSLIDKVYKRKNLEIALSRYSMMPTSDIGEGGRQRITSKGSFTSSTNGWCDGSGRTGIGSGAAVDGELCRTASSTASMGL